MKLQWLGHACFVLEHEGYRIVMDPYQRAEGYPTLSVKAHSYTCSHQHYDHFGPERVELLEETESPFAIRTVETKHDEQGGALRGSNTIHLYSAGGLTVAHLGDLGHPLTEEQLAQMGQVDVVLTPVGGFYTIDAETAKAVCDAIGPKCIIPMHYHHAPYGLSAVAGVEPFLALYPEVQHLEGDTLELTKELSGVYVPKYLG